ncbi:MAG TPA: hypothetical protein VKQ27_08805 [Acetobacteraceae bacterium]|nr:hypothetical protein [Acetobacteraceae bacterium]
MSEQFYDDVVAPALLDLAKQCRERGMPFLATVEYAPGEYGTTADLPPAAERSLPMDWSYVAARSQGNADTLILHLMKQAAERGHGSVTLAQLGIPHSPARAA